MSEKLQIVKIGGNVVDSPEALAGFITDFAALPGHKMLVHGGGKEATRLGNALGTPATMIDGRRVTDRATLDVVTMVYAGLVNKRVVSQLQAAGVNAIGLSGADGNAVRATRRPPNPVDFGYVGDISPDGVNSAMLRGLVAQGLCPVMCAIMHDGHGTLLNCNADSVASGLAIGCARDVEVELVYCFEKDGVLTDPDDPATLVEHLTPELYAAMRANGSVHSGMIPKLDNAFAALRAGVSRVIIKSAANLTCLRGTIVTL